jgi:inhibitor of cysteine peptidase
VNDTFIAPDSRLMGAGGDHHWTIKGTAAGNQTFSAVYRRPWEAPSPDDITYVQHFIVTT